MAPAGTAGHQRDAPEQAPRTAQLDVAEPLAGLHRTVQTAWQHDAGAHLLARIERRGQALRSDDGHVARAAEDLPGAHERAALEAIEAPVEEARDVPVTARLVGRSQQDRVQPHTAALRAGHEVPARLVGV